MRLLCAPLVLAAGFAAASANAGEVRIVRTAGDALRIVATEARGSEIVEALGPHLDAPLEVRSALRVSLDSSGRDGVDLAWAVAVATGQIVSRTAEGYRILPAAEATVTLDTYAESSRRVVSEMAAQCGIRNLMFDPGLPDSPITIHFENVACDAALDVVLRSAGWQSEGTGNLMRVSTP